MKKVPRFSIQSVETQMRAMCALVDGGCSDGVDDVDCGECLFGHLDGVSHAHRRQFNEWHAKWLGKEKKARNGVTGGW